MNSARALALASAAAALGGCAQIHQWLPFLGDDPAPAAISSAPAGTAAPHAKHAGPLLLFGGGRTTGAVIAEAARITAGGVGAKVLVMPLAASSPEAAKSAVETWTHAGFADCEVLDATDAAHAAAQIDAATFLWMIGTELSRMAGRLLDAGLAARIRARHEAGALVGGTNAGAAAVAESMLTGEGDDAEMLQGRSETVGGLGLWPGVIVDQHFVAKKRFNRLAAAVLDHPQFVGIGIDEGAGVVVEGSTMRVVGEANVVVIDARRAKINASRPGDASAATGVEMQILSAGMTYDFSRR